MAVVVGTGMVVYKSFIAGCALSVFDGVRARRVQMYVAHAVESS